MKKQKLFNKQAPISEVEGEGSKVEKDEKDVNDHDEEGGHGPKKAFKKSHGLTTAEAEVLLQQYGLNALEEKTVPKWYIFVSQLWQVTFKFLFRRKIAR
jgi:hypothetical protein